MNGKMLYAKARGGLFELSVPLGLEVMRMMLEENVEKHTSTRWRDG
ncbi:MAG: hypothetical protein GX488_01520 [Clostridiales bacterium]|nr:hypothetical protein [Clostridiales bacterium]